MVPGARVPTLRGKIYILVQERQTLETGKVKGFEDPAVSLPVIELVMGRSPRLGGEREIGTVIGTVIGTDTPTVIILPEQLPCLLTIDDLVWTKEA